MNRRNPAEKSRMQPKAVILLRVQVELFHGRPVFFHQSGVQAQGRLGVRGEKGFVWPFCRQLGELFPDFGQRLRIRQEIESR